MATSSITKKFVIKDEKACDTLISVLSQKSKRKKTTSNKYEEGKKLLAQHIAIGGFHLTCS